MSVYFNSSFLLLEFGASFEPTKLCVHNCLKHQITHLKSLITMSLKTWITLFGPPILGMWMFIDVIVSSFGKLHERIWCLNYCWFGKNYLFWCIGVQIYVNFMNKNDNMEKIDNMDDTMYHMNEIIFID
jgi:hypothetical protein